MDASWVYNEMSCQGSFNVSRCSSVFLVQAMTYFNEHKLTSASALLASRVKTEAPEMRNRDPEISGCCFGGGRVSFLSKNSMCYLCVIICRVSNLRDIFKYLIGFRFYVVVSSIFVSSPLPGNKIQFDSFFWDGLKPQTSGSIFTVLFEFKTGNDISFSRGSRPESRMTWNFMLVKYRCIYSTVCNVCMYTCPLQFINTSIQVYSQWYGVSFGKDPTFFLVTCGHGSRSRRFFERFWTVKTKCCFSIKLFWSIIPRDDSFAKSVPLVVNRPM